MSRLPFKTPPMTIFAAIILLPFCTAGSLKGFGTVMKDEDWCGATNKSRMQNAEAVDCSSEAEMTRVKYLKTIKSRRPQVTSLIRPTRFGKHLAHLTTYTYSGSSKRRRRARRNKCESHFDQTQSDRAAGLSRTRHWWKASIGFQQLTYVSAKYKTMTQWHSDCKHLEQGCH